MAVVGTTVAAFNSEGYWTVTVTGLTNGNESAPFTMKGSMYTSYVVSGTFGTTSLQAQGSNDGTNWANIGAAVTSAGGGTLTPAQVVYNYYRFDLTGGDGTTLIDVKVTGTQPR